jgi:hypothetical protein
MILPSVDMIETSFAEGLKSRQAIEDFILICAVGTIGQYTSCSAFPFQQETAYVDHRIVPPSYTVWSVS